jgi:hypothetical protein
LPDIKPDIWPRYRHLVVAGEKRFPTRIVRETFLAFETPAGVFMKGSKRKLDDPNVKFEGPFTADGCMESRP